MDVPTRMGIHVIGSEDCRRSKPFTNDAPKIAGNTMINEKSAASSGLILQSNPVLMVAPDRDMPGRSETACAIPIRVDFMIVMCPVDACTTIVIASKIPVMINIIHANQGCA